MKHIVVSILLLAIVLYPQVSEGIYGNCWSGNTGDGGQYYGTLSTTTSGRTCQAWSSQTPNTHTYTDDTAFSNDGSVANANNYCRDPDWNYQPWCYTTDPFYRWDTCDAPICVNLPCGINIATGAADPSTLSASVDAWTNLNYLLLDWNYMIQCCGTVSVFKMFISNPGTIRFQIWREDTTNGEYVLRAEKVYTFSLAQSNAYHEKYLVQAERISVKENDLIGWYVDADMIPYDVGTSNMNLLLPIGTPIVGQSVSFGTAFVEAARDYAIGVGIAQNMEPYFRKSGTVVIVDSLSITNAIGIGTPIYTLSYTDDDPDDIAGLSVSMTSTSIYFTLVSDKVEVLAALAVGTYPLVFEVMDECEQTGRLVLTITVTRASVQITNLPDSGDVSESETGQTHVFTLKFNVPGTLVCNIDSYSPTRPEGNPFEPALTATPENAIYLKNAATVRYSVTTVYVLDITCNDGFSSDTRVLNVNLLPNALPTFNSWISAISLCASNVSNTDVVYKATVTDAEGDAITIGMPSCLPATCPFGFTNDAEILATQDLELHEVSSYTITLSADDTFNTVVSPTLTITLTCINSRPVFTNLPKTVQVLEGTVIGSEVWHISVYDGDGDTITLTTAFAPAVACAGLFSVNAADGNVTTLVALDYEAPPPATTCTLTVTANDGKMDSTTPGVLILEITNWDEPPIFDMPLYKIITPEVTDNTLLPDPGITVTDPEFPLATVSLTLDCTPDSGHLSIDSTTRRVTMTTAYDLDPSFASYTIVCTLKGEDGTGQSSTSTLEVEITDANDNAPLFSMAMYTINILNTQAFGVIGAAPATNADSTPANQLIVYTLSGATEFDIDSSGNIKLTATPTVMTYTLTATATDGADGSLSSTATVKVFVTDGIVTTTTSTTTTAGSAGSGSQSSGFFNSSLNIIWFAIGIALGTFVLVAGSYLLYRLCKSKLGAGQTGYARQKDKKPIKEPGKQNHLRQLTEKPFKESNKAKVVRKDDTHKPPALKEKERPVSRDSGINLSDSPNANTRYRPISVEPAKDVFTTSDSMETAFNNKQIRQWKLDERQYLSVLQVGRLKH